MAHVLVVEDNEFAASGYRMLLEASGHRVTLAGSVAATIDAVHAEIPDVMLLDLTLPDGDGLDALKQLRAEGRAPGATAALTGHDDVAVGDRCREAGCSMVLLKPVSPRLLLSHVDSLFAQSRSRSVDPAESA